MRSPAPASFVVGLRVGQRRSLNRPAQAAAVEGDALDQHEYRCAWRQAQPIDRVAREPRQQCLAVAVDAKLDDRAGWRANLADGAREHVECADVGWSRLCQYDVAGAHAQTQAGTDADLETRQLPERSEERRVGKECRSRWSPY